MKVTKRGRQNRCHYPETTLKATHVITYYSTGSVLPELVSTLRGLLEEVSAAVPLGVFWAALAAAANAARFCNCIAFSPATHWRMHSFFYNSHHHPSLTDPATSAHHKGIMASSLKTTGLILVTDLFLHYDSLLLLKKFFFAQIGEFCKRPGSRDPRCRSQSTEIVKQSSLQSQKHSSFNWELSQGLTAHLQATELV